MTRRIRTLLPIIWLMTLLLLPLVAYLLGVRQPLLENHGRTAFPDLNRETVREDGTFRQMDAAIRERLPLRGEAIDMRGRIAMKVFGDSANGDVILGKEDWLYYRPEMLICEPSGRPAVPMEDVIEVLTRTIAASGRRPVVIVPGSKTITHRQHLKGVSEAELACLKEAESRVQERLEEIPGGHSIQAKLDALEAAGRPTFLRSDTHWNSLGRTVFLRELLDGVHPGLAAEARLRALREVDRPGDLGSFVGQERVDQDRLVTVTRRPRTRFPRGKVLLIGDSQLWTSIKAPGADGRTVLERVFPGQAECDQYEMQEHGCADPMLGADTVVLESVTRNFSLVGDTCWRPVATLAATVSGHLAGWADGGATRGLTPDSTPAGVAYGDDRTDALRLLRIPVLGLPAGQAADPPVSVVPEGDPRPCALTTVTDDELDLVIPVPAGESIGDLELQVSGPDGVELGRPRVLTLDDRLPSP